MQRGNFNETVSNLTNKVKKSAVVGKPFVDWKGIIGQLEMIS